MAERALILSCDTWEVSDEKTGEIRKGLSVWYVNDYRADTQDSFGFKPTKINADISLLDHLRGAKLPALFDLDLGSRPGAQGKATLTLTGLTKIQAVNLFAVSRSAQQTASA